jgi:hypothetical protein
VRVALFITCFNDTLFPRTGQAVVQVLERLGHQVEFPFEQTCCGQMHANSGYQLEAVPLVRRFVRVFGSYEAIVCPSGWWPTSTDDSRSWPGIRGWQQTWTRSAKGCTSSRRS